ncbi:MAG: hypothetical protein FJ272_02045 [Planctomycetes bacterium]|nr:hypothetical protein [Planctomycetota bacterium]
MHRATLLGLLLILVSGVSAAEGLPQVGFDSDRACLLVDGKPFFAIGCYNVVPEQMKSCAQAGMNLTVRLGSSGLLGPKLTGLIEREPGAVSKFLTSYSDAAQEAGVWLIEAPASFAPESLGYRAPEFPARFERFLDQPLGRIVDTLRRHPAVLALNSLDEPNPQMQETVTAFRRAVRERHSGRAVLLNFSRRPHEWPGAADIIASDIYMTPNESPLCELYEEVRTNVAIARRLKCPYWLLPLLESYETVGPVPPEQQVAQTYLGVIAGASGIVWWTWPPRHAATWDVMRKLAGELQALSPVLTELRPDPPVRISPPEMARVVQARVIRHGRQTFVIAANATPSPARVTFEAPATCHSGTEVWFEKRSLPLREGRWQDRFEGYGRHVYMLPDAWSAGAELKLTTSVEVPTPAAMTDTAGSPDNLIPNPGFEGDKGWQVVPADREAWADIAKRGFIDNKIAHGGQRSACLRFTDANIMLDYVSDPILLKPDSFYRFSGWIRLETAGALHRAYVFLLGGGRRMTGRLLGVENYAGWGQVSSVFSTGREPVEVRVRCRHDSNDDFAGTRGPKGSGRAWFDDFSLVRLPDTRNLIRNGSFERSTWLSGWPVSWDTLWSLIGVPGHIGGKNPLWGMDSGTAWHGKHSLRLVNPGATTSLPLDAMARSVTCHQTLSNLTLSQGQPYVFSAYLKADRPNCPVHLFVGSYRASKQVTVGTEWVRFTHSYTPQVTVYGDAYIQIRSSDPGTVWVDGVQLENGETPTEFQDAM